MKYFSGRWLIATIPFLFVTGCHTFTGEGTDNTPPPAALQSYPAQFSPHADWSRQAGGSTDKKYLTLAPAVAGNTLFITNPQGKMIAINAINGKTLWQTTLPAGLNTAPVVSGTTLLAGGNNATLYALDTSNGHMRWHLALSDIAVAPPTIVDTTLAIVKTLNGELWTINIANGSVRWRYTHGAPLMVLAGGSQPVIAGDNVMVGYADGTLAAYNLGQGQLRWETQVAQPQGASSVEQMVDIVANPLLSNNVIYVVTYQGNLAAMDAQTGQSLWKIPFSSYTGMALTPNTLFVTDAQGGVWAIARTTGATLWHQTYLHNRWLTAPAVMGNAIVVADGEGYVHWLSQASGATIARVHVSRNAILATPLVMGNSVVIVDREGKVSRYS